MYDINRNRRDLRRNITGYKVSQKVGKFNIAKVDYDVQMANRRKRVGGMTKGEFRQKMMEDMKHGE